MINGQILRFNQSAIFQAINEMCFSTALAFAFWSPETMIQIVNPPKTTKHDHHDGDQNANAVEKHISLSLENSILIERKDLANDHFMEEKTNLVLKLDEPRWSFMSSRSLSVDEKRERRSMKLTLKSRGGGIREIRILERDEEEKEEETEEKVDSEKEDEGRKITMTMTRRNSTKKEKQAKKTKVNR